MEYNKEEIINFLKQDKVNILEGLCIENEFKKQFKNWEFSEGWWGVNINSRFGYEKNLVIFHLLKNYSPNDSRNISNIDKEIYINFLEKDTPVFIVKFTQKKFGFSQLTFNKVTSELKEVIISEKELAELLNFKDPNNAVDKKTQEYPANYKFNRAIEYFTDENILEETYVERLFANKFLTFKYGLYPVNIDAVIKKPNCDKLIILEIKFKYPDRSDSFGINTGQAKLLLRLKNIGFEVLHMIAENPVKQPSIGYFELPHKKHLANSTFWYYKFLENKDLENVPKIAPGKTNINGKGIQGYIPIDKNKFSPCLDKNKEIIKVQFPSKFYKLPPCKICNNYTSKISFNTKKETYYLGCRNYEEHNKKS